MTLDFQSNTCGFAGYINHTKCLKWLLHFYVHDFNIKTRGSCFCGEKSIPVPAGKKKSTSNGNIALVYLSQQQLFPPRPCFKFMSCTTQKLGCKNSSFFFWGGGGVMCSLNFNHYCLLWQYANMLVMIKCKSIEHFHLYILMVCKYICGAFSFCGAF